MTEKLLYIMRGPAASGKTWLALSIEGATICSADKYFTHDEKYQFDPASIGEAHRVCRAKVVEAMAAGLTPIVVDNTNVTRRDLQPYLWLAQAHQYRVVIREPRWSPELQVNGRWNIEFLLQQNEQRRLKTGKFVPPEVIERHCQKWESIDAPPPVADNVFVTSDLHCGHRNILHYSNRPFGSIEEHDRVLIENWNNMVGSTDIIYCLGDLSLSGSGHAKWVIQQLKGRIHLIEGNHDRGSYAHRNLFEWWGPMKEVKIADHTTILCHFSMRTWNRMHHGTWHLYGHSHGSLPEDNTGLSADIGVDAVAMRLSGIPIGQKVLPGTTKPEHYRPMRASEVAALMETKSKLLVDHHNDATT